DDAMRRADQLLVSSLQIEERRRSRRRIILLSAIGGTIMFTAIGILMVALQSEPSAKAPDVASTSKVTAPNPDKTTRIAAEGWKLWQNQDFDAAADKFEEAVKLDPKNTNARNGLGWALFNGGDFGKAEEAFKQLIKREPNHPAALNGLGQLALAQGR